MKVETVLVLETLSLKIWKTLNKEQNFRNFYRHEWVKSIQNITLANTFPSFFLRQGKFVIEEVEY